MPLPETLGYSWASLSQSHVGSRLLSSGSWCTQGSVCVLPESVSPALCKLWQLCGGLMATSSNRAYAIPRSPAPEPLPQQSTADLYFHRRQPNTVLSQSLWGLGSWCGQGIFGPSEHLWRVWGLILKAVSPSYHLAGAFPLLLNVGYLLTAAPGPHSCHASATQLRIWSPIVSLKEYIEIETLKL